MTIKDTHTITITVIIEIHPVLVTYEFSNDDKYFLLAAFVS